jgi:hypothetical protein
MAPPQIGAGKGSRNPAAETAISLLGGKTPSALSSSVLQADGLETENGILRGKPLQIFAVRDKFFCRLR